MKKIMASFREVAHDINILIVEDEFSLQNEWFEELSKYFKEVDVAFNTKDALALCEQKNYDVIMANLKISGIEFIETIHLINKTKHIIITSQDSQTLTLIKLINMGIDKFLLKPIHLKTMIFQFTRVCQLIQDERMLEYLLNMLEDSNNTLVKRNNELEKVLNTCGKSGKTEEKEPVEISRNTSFNTMSALEFQEAYPFELDKTNEALEDLEDKFNVLIGKNINEGSHEIWLELISLLRDFAKEIELIPQFSKLAYGIQQLQRTFESIGDDSKLSAAIPMITSLFDSLEAWRKSVFCYRDAQDIHYMDDSLISDALSLENFISNQNTVSDSDMEFF